jgi:hypothetical protein
LISRENIERLEEEIRMWADATNGVVVDLDGYQEMMEVEGLIRDLAKRNMSSISQRYITLTEDRKEQQIKELMNYLKERVYAYGEDLWWDYLDRKFEISVLFKYPDSTYEAIYIFIERGDS